jgi:hypothetical protein
MRAIYENYLRAKYGIPNGLDVQKLAELLQELTEP